MAGTEMAAPTEAAWRRWTDEQRKLVKATVAQGTTDPELYMFLELAARYDLDPFAHEIWAAKGKTKDGKPGRMMILVGRDGLIKIANREPRYRGYDADVVHEADRFERVEPDPDSKTLRQRGGVVHAYGHPSKRGPIVGAWCLVDVEGRPPRYAFTFLSEYKPTGQSDYSPWGKQTSVMIEKCAISVAHRTAFPISGIYLHEEVQAGLAGADVEAEAIEAGEAGEVDFGPDEELAERLRAAFERANELEPNAYSPAVIQMTVTGQPPEQLARILELVEAENEQREAVAGEPSSEVEESEHPPDEGASAPSEPDEVTKLRVRLGHLLDALDAADPGSEEQGALSDEIEVVEARLREIAGEDPEQETLGL